MPKFLPAFLLFMLLPLGTARANPEPQLIARSLRSAIVGLSIGTGTQPRQEERSEEKTTSSIHLTTKGTAVGSGVLISSDGLVLTVASLLGNPGEIVASLEDGTKKNAVVVARDRALDLALLRIAGPISTYVTLEDVALPALGERLVAIGRASPELDAVPILTEGIASSVADASSSGPAYIQSTAQLLPGMGGGPLVSQKSGKVVGINSSTYVNRSTGVSVAFAVPIQVFMRVRAELLAKGRVSRYVMGVGTAPVTDELRSAIGLTGKDGVLIVSVREKGPAARAGMLPGDIVVQVNKLPVPNAMSMFEAINAHGPSPNLQLVVFRRGSMTSLAVHPEELSER